MDKSDAARAKAAGREIDEANDNVRAARELRSSVTEANKEILRSQHDSIMATLASRRMSARDHGGGGGPRVPGRYR